LRRMLLRDIVARSTVAVAEGVGREWRAALRCAAGGGKVGLCLETVSEEAVGKGGALLL
jgi:hypothetical protein